MTHWGYVHGELTSHQGSREGCPHADCRSAFLQLVYDEATDGAYARHILDQLDNPESTPTVTSDPNIQEEHVAARTTKAKTAAPAEPEVDLLDELESGLVETTEDLLDTLDDVSAPPWLPEDPKPTGKKDENGRPIMKYDGIQGKVISRNEITSSFKDPNTGEFPIIPVIILEDKAGDLFRVMAFHSVLRREIEEQDPQPGDTVAMKYFGKKKPTKGNGEPYHHYKVAVRRAR